MPCFFIISGLLFSEKYLSSVKTFYKKRIKSLWWPFVKWTWIFLFFHNIFYASGIYSDSYTLKEMLYKSFTTLLMLHNEQLIGGFWFIRSLFIASIFSVTYFKLFGFSIKSSLIGIVLLLATAEILCILNLKIYYINSFNLLACAYFLTGALFRLINFKEIKYKKFICAISVLLLGLSLLDEKREMLELNDKILLPYFFQSIIISFSFLTLIEIYKGKEWTKFFYYLGDKTLDILIIHFIAFRLVSVIKIEALGLDYDHMKDFPVIESQNEYFWVLYVVVALLVALAFSGSKKYLGIWYHKVWEQFKAKKNEVTT